MHPGRMHSGSLRMPMADPSFEAKDWIIGGPRWTRKTRKNIFGAKGISLRGLVRMLS